MRSLAGSYAASITSADDDCRQFAKPIDRRSPAKSRMRPVPIPEVLPFVEMLSKVDRFWISRRPEFLEIGALGALHLTVEVW